VAQRSGLTDTHEPGSCRCSLILAPVDAEMGRGNGQVQIQTRSGDQRVPRCRGTTSKLGIDANLWANNRNQTPNSQGKVEALSRPEKLHDYSLTFGGPIKKNKTFFYVVESADHRQPADRESNSPDGLRCLGSSATMTTSTTGRREPQYLRSTSMAVPDHRTAALRFLSVFGPWRPIRRRTIV
jgi:hypothetical protein